MPLDGVTLRKAFTFIQRMKPRYLRQVYMPDCNTLYLVFDSVCVFLYLNPSCAFISAADSPVKVETLAPMGGLLRSKLKGARLLEFRQLGSDRIFVFKFSIVDIRQEPVEYELYVELMGRNTNLILVQDGRIVDALRRRSDSTRILLPGAPFERYVHEGMDFFAIDTDELVRILMESGLPLHEGLPRFVQGLSKTLVHEILRRADVDSVEEIKLHHLEKLCRILKDMAEEITSDDLCYIYTSPLDIAPLKLRIREPPSYVEPVFKAFSRFMSLKTGFSQLGIFKRRLLSVLNTETKRIMRLLEKLELEIREAMGYEKFRKNAELIFSHAYRLKNKCEFVVLEDYETGTLHRIRLDPSVTPIQNAQRFMKMYSKMKRRIEIATRRVEELEKKLEYLNSLKELVELAENVDDLKLLKEEMLQHGFLKSGDARVSKKMGGKKKVFSNIPGRVFECDGYKIVAGRNNVENDLIRRKASPNDLWCHARELPGSHVIVMAGGREIPEKVKILAARIAAYYSRGRNDTKVYVDCTEVKNVKKPKGSYPGYVVYRNERSFLVTPLTAEELKKYMAGDTTR